MKVVLAAAVLLAGCSSGALDIDMERFTRLPRLENLDYSKVDPAEPHRFWELRWSFGPGSGEGRVLGSGGTVDRSQLDSATIAALDQTRPASGFSISCLPGYCYKYIVAVNGAIRVYANTEALLEFLGEIGSVEEAALLVDARNIYLDPDNPDTGFNGVSSGWEFVGLQLVRDCAPVQTDRVHVLVRRDGSVVELGRELHSKLENACV